MWWDQLPSVQGLVSRFVTVSLEWALPEGGIPTREARPCGVSVSVRSSHSLRTRPRVDLRSMLNPEAATVR